MISLYRIDDRLVHGQVVLGWGQALHAGFIVLVDDEVSRSDWEQELYRMGVPPGMDLYFSDLAAAARDHAAWSSDPRPGILLTPDIETMLRLVAAVQGIGAVNIGGLHHRPGRTQRLRYVFLTDGEESELRDLAQKNVAVTAQDVPNARPVPLDEVLAGEEQR